MKSIFNSKGVALIIVMLIILASMAIALVSLNITRNDNRISSAYTYNRQAAYAAHVAGNYVHDRSNSYAPEILSKLQIEGTETAMKKIDEKGDDITDADIVNAIRQTSSNAKYLNQTNDITGFKVFSGMASTPPTTGETRLKGDLSKPITLTGTIGNPVLSSKLVAGFSDGDAYCNYSMHAESYALVGRAIPVREKGGKKYYLLSDLNARVSGFKREMGLLDAGTVACHQ